MPEDRQELRRINWSECFPFTNLFRAFGLAIQPTKLALALCGILAIYAVGRAIDFVTPSSHQPAVMVENGRQVVTELDAFLLAPGDNRRQAAITWTESLGKPEEIQRVGTFSVLLRQSAALADDAADAVLAGDFDAFAGVFVRAALTKYWLIEMHRIFAVFFAIFWLLIWGLFGGAICRAAALHAAREEQVSFLEALSFAKARLRSLVLVPLLPSILIFVGGIVLVLGGFVGTLPWIGDLFVGAFFFLALAVGFAMALLFFGAVGGSGLMFPTIAAEGSDALDALARSYSYVFMRPWKTFFYYLVSMLYGAICFAFVKLFARVALILVALFVGWSMNVGNANVASGDGSERSQVDKLTAMWQAPEATPGTPFWGSFGDAELAGSSWLAQLMIKGWIYLVWALVAAFLISFAYSACTLIYFLLRRDVDATDMEDVYLDNLGDPVGAGAAPSAKPSGDASGGTSLPVIDSP